MDRKSCTALMAAILFNGNHSEDHDENLIMAKDVAEELWDLVDEDDCLFVEHIEDCPCDCHGSKCVVCD